MERIYKESIYYKSKEGCLTIEITLFRIFYLVCLTISATPRFALR